MIVEHTPMPRTVMLHSLLSLHINDNKTRGAGTGASLLRIKTQDEQKPKRSWQLKYVPSWIWQPNSAYSHWLAAWRQTVSKRRNWSQCVDKVLMYPLWRRSVIRRCAKCHRDAFRHWLQSPWLQTAAHRHCLVIIGQNTIIPCMPTHRLMTIYLVTRLFFDSHFLLVDKVFSQERPNLFIYNPNAPPKMQKNSDDSINKTQTIQQLGHWRDDSLHISRVQTQCIHHLLIFMTVMLKLMIMMIRWWILSTFSQNEYHYGGMMSRILLKHLR